MNKTLISRLLAVILITTAATTVQAEFVLPEGSYVTMTGIVTELDGGRFLLDAGDRKMRVDAENLAYDPFDDEGLQRIEKGQRVQVYGEIIDGFFRTQALKAERVVSLSETESGR